MARRLLGATTPVPGISTGILGVVSIFSQPGTCFHPPATPNDLLLPLPFPEDRLVLPPAMGPKSPANPHHRSPGHNVF